MNDDSSENLNGITISFLRDMVKDLSKDDQKVKLIPFKTPKLMIENHVTWDIGFLGKKDERAEHVDFTDSVFGIPAYFLGCK